MWGDALRRTRSSKSVPSCEVSDCGPGTSIVRHIYSSRRGHTRTDNTYQTSIRDAKANGEYEYVTNI